MVKCIGKERNCMQRLKGLFSVLNVSALRANGEDGRDMNQTLQFLDDNDWNQTLFRKNLCI